MPEPRRLDLDRVRVRKKNWKVRLNGMCDDDDSALSQNCVKKLSICTFKWNWHKLFDAK